MTDNEYIEKAMVIERKISKVHARILALRAPLRKLEADKAELQRAYAAERSPWVYGPPAPRRKAD